MLIVNSNSFYQNDIFIVEDNIVQQKILNHFLKQLGFNIYMFSYAEDALECIDEINPDMILLDINLQGISGLDMLKKLGTDKEDLVNEVIVNDVILESYVGNYELQPGFVLTISRDGNQLKAQATGQPEFPVFPKSENVFYYKVVEAQLTFNQNDNGKIESVTLHQAGQKIVGKKLEN